LPVRVAFREPQPFKFGLRVEVEIDAGTEASAKSVASQTPEVAGDRTESR
jgi:hypothetical protein